MTVNAKFYVTGMTDNGSWRTLDIEYIDRDGWVNISNGDDVFMSISIIGDRGTQGLQGTQGVQGTFKVRLQGLQGLKGTTGDTGSQGVQGLQGLNQELLLVTQEGDLKMSKDWMGIHGSSGCSGFLVL